MVKPLCNIAVVALWGLLQGADPAVCQDPIAPNHRSELVSFALSAAATAPVALGFVIRGDTRLSSEERIAYGWACIVTAATLGPGVGHLYAGTSDRYPVGVLTRAAGFVLFHMGHTLRHGSDPPFESDALRYGGVAMVIGSALVDLIWAPALIRERNLRAAPRARSRLNLDFHPAGLQLRINL